MDGEAAPPVPISTTWSVGDKRELPTNPVQLGYGGFLQGHVRAFEQGAGIAHGGIEHAAEELIADVVVGTYVTAVRRRRPPPHSAKGIGKNARGPAEAILGFPEDPAISNEDPDELCQGVAVPPTIHVALAEANGSPAQHRTVGS